MNVSGGISRPLTLHKSRNSATHRFQGPQMVLEHENFKVNDEIDFSSRLPTFRREDGFVFDQRTGLRGDQIFSKRDYTRSLMAVKRKVPVLNAPARSHEFLQESPLRLIRQVTSPDGLWSD